MQQGVLNVAKTAIIKKATSRFLVKSVFLLVKKTAIRTRKIHIKSTHIKKRPSPKR